MRGVSYKIRLGICLFPVETPFSSALPVSTSILRITRLSFQRLGGAAATDQ